MATRTARQRNLLPPCYYEGFLEKRSFKDKVGGPVTEPSEEKHGLLQQGQQKNKHIQLMDHWDSSVPMVPLKTAQMSQAGKKSLLNDKLMFIVFSCFFFKVSNP